jgi:hypothetical protein
MAVRSVSVYIGGPTGAERLRYVQAYVFPEHEPIDQVRQLGERSEIARWEGDDACDAVSRTSVQA